MKLRTALLLASLAVATATARPALAVMDPAHAQADVDAAMKEHDYPFCRDPHEPLSSRAVDLCGHASAIPGCAGYVAACGRATTPPPPSAPPWWLRWLSIPPFIGTLAQVLVWLLVAALVIAVIIPIARGLARIRRKEPLPAEKKAPGAIAPVPVMAEVASLTDEEEILARARELAARGELAASMQLYLVASLRALDKRGAVRIAKDRTNGEYVRACSDPGAKPALRDIVREVDRVQFGGEPATTDGLERAARQAIAIVRALPVTMLLVLACLSLGCGGVSMPKPRQKGDDPAGLELMRDVVARQGVNLHGLDSSLATMPLPAPGERAPAVLIDMDRTSVDDETREHLLAWVDAGGVLVLAGFPSSWPKELKAKSATAAAPLKITARRLLLRAPPRKTGEAAGEATPEDGDDEPDDEPEKDIYAHTNERGEVVDSGGLAMGATPDRIAWFDDGTTYAASVRRGRGVVVGIATDELLTNAGLARPGNAAALVAILSSAARTEMRMASSEDGVSPPSTPIAALLRAGLGLALAHAAVFTLVLFAAVGRRHARPRPVPPPRRRAFSEHVEAVGALYARARSSPHALAAYARFADERLRARMPRGSGDVASFLASRARMPLHVCQQLWARAMQAKSGAPPLGDELAVLRELSSLYAAAMAQDR
jgi:hypothetical protein